MWQEVSRMRENHTWSWSEVWRSELSQRLLQMLQVWRGPEVWISSSLQVSFLFLRGGDGGGEDIL